MGLDAGPESCKLFAKTILASKTILWNGPAGVFEFESFDKGSKATLDACIQAKDNGATVIVGGVSLLCPWITGPLLTRSLRCHQGDTATVCVKFGAEDKLSHISTGGGTASPN